MEFMNETWSITLLNGTAAHTSEATALRSLLFAAVERMAEELGKPVVSREVFERELGVVWEGVRGGRVEERGKGRGLDRKVGG